MVGRTIAMVDDVVMDGSCDMRTGISWTDAGIYGKFSGFANKQDMMRCIHLFEQVYADRGLPVPKFYPHLVNGKEQPTSVRIDGAHASAFAEHLIRGFSHLRVARIP